MQKARANLWRIADARRLPRWPSPDRRAAPSVDDRICARGDAGAVVRRVLLELRDDGVADDHSRDRIGHIFAGAIARCDRYLALVGSDQEQDAVVALFAAELPVPPKPVSVIVDLAPFETFDSGDGEG